MTPHDESPVATASPTTEAIEAWAQYSQDRYESAERRLADFRGWARQLAAAAAVLVGLDAALATQVLKVEGIPVPALALCLGVLFLAAGYQMYVLQRAAEEGYVGQEGLGPEWPAVLANHLSDGPSTRRMIAAYYAKGHDSIHPIAEGVAKRVGSLARHFARSLWLVFASLLLTAGLVAVSPDGRKKMPENPAGGEGAAPASPAAESPAQPAPTQTAPVLPSSTPASPLLATPTPGQPETHAMPSPRATLLATPTPGQKITEAKAGKR